MRTRQVRTAAAVLPVALRTSARMAAAVLPVTLTPFWLRQLLKAARAEALIVRPPKPPPKPAGAYLAHALNAADSAADAVPVKDGRGRGDPLGKAVGKSVGRAPGEKDPRGRPPNSPGLIVTPCCFRQVWNALSPADAVAVGLSVPAAAALPLLLPPHAASASAPGIRAAGVRNRRPFMWSPGWVVSG